VGGKRRLLPELLSRLPGRFGAYHEPFVGGGALFFELRGCGAIGHAILSDINVSLIDVYIGLRDWPQDVIEALRVHRYDRDYFYYIRSLAPETLTPAERAARIIYLNKTCYNGLYRENRSGQFNAPFGRYDNPVICDEANLAAASQALRGTEITCTRFTSVLAMARPGDLVYFDPPYHPVSATAHFTQYDRQGFGESDQRELCSVFSQLTERGVYALLSNSDTELIRRLYADYRKDIVYAPRVVNSKVTDRGRVAELLIVNF
jgi:DNA adenine methylase